MITFLFFFGIIYAQEVCRNITLKYNFDNCVGVPNNYTCPNQGPDLYFSLPFKTVMTTGNDSFGHYIERYGIVEDPSNKIYNTDPEWISVSLVFDIDVDFKIKIYNIEIQFLSAQKWVLINDFDGNFGICTKCFDPLATPPHMYFFRIATPLSGEYPNLSIYNGHEFIYLSKAFSFLLPGNSPVLIDSGSNDKMYRVLLFNSYIYHDIVALMCSNITCSSTELCTGYNCTYEVESITSDLLELSQSHEEYKINLTAVTALYDTCVSNLTSVSILCFGYYSFQDEVCNGSGICIAEDTCKCATLYDGTYCERSNITTILQGACSDDLDLEECLSRIVVYYLNYISAMVSIGISITAYVVIFCTIFILFIGIMIINKI